MEKNELYQSLLNIMVDYLPDEWEKIVAMFICDEKVCSYSLYAKLPSGKYTSCMEDSEESDFDVDDMLEMLSLDKEENNETWITMTMIIQNTGDFNVEYDYDKPDYEEYSHIDKWINKYLV